jgi:hypothetical protein
MVYLIANLELYSVAEAIRNINRLMHAQEKRKVIPILPDWVFVGDL